jgi:hypothetical protein
MSRAHVTPALGVHAASGVWSVRPRAGVCLHRPVDHAVQHPSGQDHDLRLEDQ